MPAEVPLQVDMFTGALVDTRTAAQKQRDAAATKPRQMEMFSQRELAQYIPPSKMSLPDTATLMLVMEDPRTEEEKERDRERDARARMTPLFLHLETPEPPAAIHAPEEADSEGVGDDASTATDLTPEAQQAAARAELERVVTDITQTIAATPDVLRAQSMWLTLAALEAQSAGISHAEVKRILEPLAGAPKPKEYPVWVFNAHPDRNQQPDIWFAPSFIMPYPPPALV